ncbi:unnamed protein product [Amoebophrya sp. A25]|nr:unnamed protein product [Amoebophrya sp. A25]|eukprot:GSA25T00017697001.1
MMFHLQILHFALLVVSGRFQGTQTHTQRHGAGTAHKGPSSGHGAPTASGSFPNSASGGGANPGVMGVAPSASTSANNRSWGGSGHQSKQQAAQRLMQAAHHAGASFQAVPQMASPIPGIHDVDVEQLRTKKQYQTANVVGIGGATTSVGGGGLAGPAVQGSAAGAAATVPSSTKPGRKFVPLFTSNNPEDTNVNNQYYDSLDRQLSSGSTENDSTRSWSKSSEEQSQHSWTDRSSTGSTSGAAAASVLVPTRTSTTVRTPRRSTTSRSGQEVIEHRSASHNPSANPRATSAAPPMTREGIAGGAGTTAVGGPPASGSLTSRGRREPGLWELPTAQWTSEGDASQTEARKQQQKSNDGGGDHDVGAAVPASATVVKKIDRGAPGEQGNSPVSSTSAEYLSGLDGVTNRTSESDAALVLDPADNELLEQLVPMDLDGNEPGARVGDRGQHAMDVDYNLDDASRGEAGREQQALQQVQQIDADPTRRTDNMNIADGHDDSEDSDSERSTTAASDLENGDEAVPFGAFHSARLATTTRKIADIDGDKDVAAPPPGAPLLEDETVDDVRVATSANKNGVTENLRPPTVVAPPATPTSPTNSTVSKIDDSKKNDNMPQQEVQETIKIPASAVPSRQIQPIAGPTITGTKAGTGLQVHQQQATGTTLGVPRKQVTTPHLLSHSFIRKNEPAGGNDRTTTAADRKMNALFSQLESWEIPRMRMETSAPRTNTELIGKEVRFTLSALLNEAATLKASVADVLGDLVVRKLFFQLVREVTRVHFVGPHGFLHPGNVIVSYVGGDEYETMHVRLRFNRPQGWDAVDDDELLFHLAEQHQIAQKKKEAQMKGTVSNATTAASTPGGATPARQQSAGTPVGASNGGNNGTSGADPTSPSRGGGSSPVSPGGAVKGMMRAYLEQQRPWYFYLSPGAVQWREKYRSDDTGEVELAEFQIPPSMSKDMDVYSLGAILFEMYRGRKLFQASSVTEIYQRIRNLRPENLRREMVATQRSSLSGRGSLEAREGRGATSSDFTTSVVTTNGNVSAAGAMNTTSNLQQELEATLGSVSASAEEYGRRLKKLPRSAQDLLQLLLNPTRDQRLRKAAGILQHSFLLRFETCNVKTQQQQQQSGSSKVILGEGSFGRVCQGLLFEKYPVAVKVMRRKFVPYVVAERLVRAGVDQKGAPVSDPRERKAMQRDLILSSQEAEQFEKERHLLTLCRANEQDHLEQLQRAKMEQRLLDDEWVLKVADEIGRGFLQQHQVLRDFFQAFAHTTGTLAAHANANVGNGWTAGALANLLQQLQQSTVVRANTTNILGPILAAPGGQQGVNRTANQIPHGTTTQNGSLLQVAWRNLFGGGGTPQQTSQTTYTGGNVMPVQQVIEQMQFGAHPGPLATPMVQASPTGQPMVAAGLHTAVPYVPSGAVVGGTPIVSPNGSAAPRNDPAAVAQDPFLLNALGTPVTATRSLPPPIQIPGLMPLHAATPGQPAGAVPTGGPQLPGAIGSPAYSDSLSDGGEDDFESEVDSDIEEAERLTNDQDLEILSAEEFQEKSYTVSLHESFETYDSFFLITALVPASEEFEKYFRASLGLDTNRKSRSANKRETPELTALPMAVDKIRKYFAQMALALLRYQMTPGGQFREKNVLLHRDIKLENMLLSRPPGKEDKVVLIDLGLGTVQQGPRDTVKGEVGTPYYVAPEVLSGEPYNQACDVWSLGVVLFRLLCNRFPFPGNEAEVVYRKIRKGNPEWPARAMEYVPADARDLVEKMLNKHPGRRITMDQVLRHEFIAKLPKDIYMALGIPRGVSIFRNELQAAHQKAESRRQALGQLVKLKKTLPTLPAVYQQHFGQHLQESQQQQGRFFRFGGSSDDYLDSVLDLITELDPTPPEVPASPVQWNAVSIGSDVVAV